MWESGKAKEYTAERRSFFDEAEGTTDRILAR